MPWFTWKAHMYVVPSMCLVRTELIPNAGKYHQRKQEKATAEKESPFLIVKIIQLFRSFLDVAYRKFLWRLCLSWSYHVVPDKPVMYETQSKTFSSCTLRRWAYMAVRALVPPPVVMIATTGTCSIPKYMHLVTWSERREGHQWLEKRKLQHW